MLSHEDLAPHYGKVTWLFVTRNFKGDDKDREAARTHDRFGVTSWPHTPIFDPRDDRVLAWLPRNLKGFVAGIDRYSGAVPAAGAKARAAAEEVRSAIALRANGKEREALQKLAKVAAATDEAGLWLQARELQREWSGAAGDLGAMLEDPDVRQRAIAVERVAELEPAAQKPHLPRLRRALVDAEEHLMVRLRAVRVLAATAPEAIVEHGASLLAVANDPFRFEVLGVLAKHPAPALVPVLLELFTGAGGRVPSGNPNVLRSRVARCLATSGDARAVPVLAVEARKANVRMALTGVAVSALTAIGAREGRGVRRQVIEVLRESFPPPLEDAGLEGFGDRAERFVLTGVGRVRDALETLGVAVPELPQHWSRVDREEFLAALPRAP